MIAQRPTASSRRSVLGLLLALAAVTLSCSPPRPAPSTAKRATAAATAETRTNSSQKHGDAVNEEIEDRLDARAPSIRLDKAPLSDVLDMLRDKTGVSIVVKWNALKEAGIDPTTPVSVHLSNVKYSKALTLILADAGDGKAKLGTRIGKGVLKISTANDLALDVITRTYDIRDLLASPRDLDFDDAPQLNVPNFPGPSPTPPTASPSTHPTPSREEAIKQIIQIIEDTVASDSWKDCGGLSGTIREQNGLLIVTQTPEN